MRIRHGYSNARFMNMHQTRFTRYKDIRGVSTTRTGIPRILWSYWDNDGEPPMLVYICLATWERFLPDFTIVVITPKTLPKYLPDLHPKTLPWNDSVARESDIIRLNLLARYGGVWSDASILLFDVPEFLPWLDTCAVVLYYQDRYTTLPDSKIVESWWFATVPDSAFVRAWRDAFMMTGFTGTIRDRLAYYMHKMHVDVQQIAPFHLEYLLIHVAAQFVLQKVLSPSDVAALCFLKAEDGPFKLHVDADWKGKAAIDALCLGPARPPITKLTRYERAEATDEHVRRLLAKLTM